MSSCHMVASGVVGPAKTFVSHCWGDSWGDLVAAVSDGADENRRVWVDIFVVRQWPCGASDLDFVSMIHNCSSFLLVCPSLDEIAKMSIAEQYSKNTLLLSRETRSKIAFPSLVFS